MSGAERGEEEGEGSRSWDWGGAGEGGVPVFGNCSRVGGERLSAGREEGGANSVGRRFHVSPSWRGMSKPRFGDGVVVDEEVEGDACWCDVRVRWWRGLWPRRQRMVETSTWWPLMSQGFWAASGGRGGASVAAAHWVARIGRKWVRALAREVKGADSGAELLATLARVGS